MSPNVILLTGADLLRFLFACGVVAVLALGGCASPHDPAPYFHVIAEDRCAATGIVDAGEHRSCVKKEKAAAENRYKRALNELPPNASDFDKIKARFAAAAPQEE